MNDFIPKSEESLAQTEQAGIATPKIRILVVHPNRLLREALAVALAAQRQSLQVVGCVEDATRLTAASLLPNRWPHVIVLKGDVSSDDRARHVALLQRLYQGAAILLIRDGSFKHLLKSISLVARYQAIPSERRPGIHTSETATLVAMGLTAREQDIFRLRRQGMSNKEVAAALHLEVQTVKNHMHNLSLKLHLSHLSRQPNVPTKSLSSSSEHV